MRIITLNLRSASAPEERSSAAMQPPFLFMASTTSAVRTQSANGRKKKSTPSVEAASEMFPPPKKYNPLGRQPAREDRAALYDDLKKYGNFTGLWWIMSPEPAPAATLPVTTVEEVIYSEEFLHADGQEKQLDILFKKMRVQEAAVKEVSLLTLGQRGQSLLASDPKGTSYCE